MNRRTSALVALAASATLFAACGSDDDDGNASDTAAFCRAVIDTQNSVNALESPDGDPAAVEAAFAAIEASALADIADTAAVLVAEGRTSLETGPTDAFFEAYGEVATWMVDSCDYQVAEVHAQDYKFEGVPATMETGPAIFTFSNEGNEEHEFLFIRINEGVTESIEELVAMPEEESASKITFAGAAFASAGGTSATVAELEAGHYAAVCFIPVGSTPEAVAQAEANGTEIDGQPHAMAGMVAEFDVA